MVLGNVGKEIWTFEAGDSLARRNPRNHAKDIKTGTFRGSASRGVFGNLSNVLLTADVGESFWTSRTFESGNFPARRHAKKHPGDL